MISTEKRIVPKTICRKCPLLNSKTRDNINGNATKNAAIIYAYARKIFGDNKKPYKSAGNGLRVVESEFTGTDISSASTAETEEELTFFVKTTNALSLAFVETTLTG